MTERIRSLLSVGSPLQMLGGGKLFMALKRLKRPRDIHHYASPAALLGVIQTRKIWATDIRFLNDSQEWEHGCACLQSLLLACRTDEYYTHDLERLDEMARMVAESGHHRMAVACFSRKQNDLSQWRGYCPPEGGYAIGFSSKKLERLHGCDLLPCIYDPEEHERLAQLLIDSYIDDSRNSPHANTTEIERRNRFIFGVLSLASILKEKSFSDEDEWRLVRPYHASEEETCFRPGFAGIVPYLPIELWEDGKPAPLTRVCVGPNPQMALAVESVEALLHAHQLDCPVEKSHISFRPR